MIEEKKDIATPEPKRLASKDLVEGFALIEEGVAKFEVEYPDMERYIKVVREVSDCLQYYKKIWEENIIIRM